MMQLKIFKVTKIFDGNNITTDVGFEEQVNEWLKDNPNVIVNKSDLHTIFIGQNENGLPTGFVANLFVWYTINND